MNSSPVPDELVQFVAEHRTKGIADDEIRKVLVEEGGWTEADVNQALGVATPNANASTAVPNNAGLPPETNAPSSVPTGTASPLGQPLTSAAAESMDATTVTEPTSVRHAAWGMSKMATVFILIIVLAGGGSAAAYYFATKQTESDLAPWEQVMVAYESIYSGTYKTNGSFTIDITMKQDEGDSSSEGELNEFSFGPLEFSYGIDMDFAAAIDQTDKENIKMDMNMGGDVSFNFGFFNMQLAGDVDAITLGDIAYLRLNELTSPGFFDISPFLDRWIQVDPIELAKLELELGGSELEDIEELAKQQAEAEERMVARLTEYSQSEAVQQILRESVVENGEVSVNDQQTRLYNIQLTQSQWRSILLAVFDIVLTEAEHLFAEYDEFEGVDQGFLEQELEEVIEVVVPMLAQTRVDLYISPKDSLIYRMDLTMPIDISGLELGDTELTGLVEMQAFYSDYGEPVTITAPADYVPLEDLLEDLFSDLMMLEGSVDMEMMSDEEFDDFMLEIEEFESGDFEFEFDNGPSATEENDTQTAATLQAMPHGIPTPLMTLFDVFIR